MPTDREALDEVVCLILGSHFMHAAPELAEAKHAMSLLNLEWRLTILNTNELE